MSIQILMKDFVEEHFELMEKYFADDGLLEKEVYTLMGIKENTFYFWKRSARQILESIEKGELKEEDLNDGQRKALRLLSLCEIGRAKAIQRNLGYIQDAGKDPAHWHAAAWYLERTEPDRFGKKQDINFKGMVGTMDIELTEEEDRKFKENLGVFFGKHD